MRTLANLVYAANAVFAGSPILVEAALRVACCCSGCTGCAAGCC
jgi:hypothetical protein